MTRKREKNPYFVETNYEQCSIILTPAGDLVGEMKSWVEHSGAPPSGAFEVRRYPLDDWSVMLFDFSKDSRRYQAHGSQIVTDYFHGEKLLVHSKGVGISRRLKSLLDGSFQGAPKEKPSPSVTQPSENAGLKKSTPAPGVAQPRQSFLRWLFGGDR
jgi:hypothetical protein